MMNTSSDDKSTIRSKLENNNDNDEKLSKALARAASSSSATTTTSRQWAGFKNPRIVRVSRTFGGKDRHSKVCTIRGLRDRRIRLSVPTAIQLYDLQDRLGLSQPSKVIDWLLDATKLDIDKLPPLQIPPGNFVDFHQQQALFGNTHQFTPYNLSSMKEGVSNESSSGMLLSSKEGININDDVDVDEDEDEDDEDNSMEVNLESMSKWNKKTSSDDNGGSSSVQSFFPMGGNNGYLMNNAGGLMPYNNMYQWDLSLSQLASHGSSSSSLPSQTEEARHNYSSTHQLFFCPPLATTPLFPQHDNRFHLSNTYGSGFVEEQMHSGENNAGHENKGNNN